MLMRRVVLLCLCALGLACGVPKDPDGTLEHVQGGVMRVGVAVHEPWTSDSAGQPGGIEPALVRALAQELRARVTWVRGGESVLLPRLHERELDLVIAGLDAKTAWKSKIGMTSPYVTLHDATKRKMVWAVAPGENAWQMRVERFLREQKPNIERATEHVDEMASP